MQGHERNLEVVHRMREKLMSVQWQTWNLCAIINQTELCKMLQWRWLWNTPRGSACIMSATKKTYYLETIPVIWHASGHLTHCPIGINILPKLWFFPQYLWKTERSLPLKTKTLELPKLLMVTLKELLWYSDPPIFWSKMPNFQHHTENKRSHGVTDNEA